MLLSILSSLGAGILGEVQSHREHKRDIEKELALARIQSEKEIELAKQGIALAQNQLQTQESVTTQEQYKTQASTKSSDVEEYKAFADASTQTSSLWQSASNLANIANFITQTTRPIITYITLLFAIIIGCRLIFSVSEIDENTLVVFDMVLAEFSAISSYWFVRRSFEKRKAPEFSSTSKKKTEVMENNVKNETTPSSAIPSSTSAPLIPQSWNKEDVLKQCINVIAEHEGWSLKAYLCPAKKWTIGYGHVIMVNGKQATNETYTFEQLPAEFQKISKAKANAIFENDILIFLNPVIKQVGSICNGNQITALTSFAFNLGMKKLMDSTLLKVIKENPQNFVEIRKQFNRWIYAGKIVLKGLQKRRKEEADLYEKA